MQLTGRDREMTLSAHSVTWRSVRVVVGVVAPMHCVRRVWSDWWSSSMPSALNHMSHALLPNHHSFSCTERPSGPGLNTMDPSYSTTIETIHLTSTHYPYPPASLLVPQLAIDLFIFYPEYYVLVCKSCAYAVASLHLAAHVATKHTNNICSKDSLHRATKTAATLASCLEHEYSLLNPTTNIMLWTCPTQPTQLGDPLYRTHEGSSAPIIYLSDP
jgi:hypothetical protein